RTQIEHRGLSTYFKFIGLVPPQEIPAHIAATDLVVHTSLREGLARVLPQALIAGKPVISYDIDGAREVVIANETGFLLPPQSIEPLASATVTLARDPALRKRLGEEGRRRFTDQFRHETMARQIRALYERVLATKKSRENEIVEVAAPNR
ncbi:MAG TPA: glycosyltransferase, partial [Pirellulales bacterium]